MPGDACQYHAGSLQALSDSRQRIVSLDLVRIGANVSIKLTRGGDTISTMLIPQEMIIPAQDSSDENIHMGVGDAGIYPRHRIVVAETPFAGSVAEKVGVLKGDTITEINHQWLYDYQSVVKFISGSEGNPLTLTIHRGADTLYKEVSPVYNEEYKRYMIGIRMQYVMFRETHIVKRNLPDAVVKASATSWKLTTSVFRYFKRLFQGQVKVDAMSENLSNQLFPEKEEEK